MSNPLITKAGDESVVSDVTFVAMFQSLTLSELVGKVHVGCSFVYFVELNNVAPAGFHSNKSCRKIQIVSMQRHMLAVEPPPRPHTPPPPHSCIRGECHNLPILIPVQRSQRGVTSSGPSHCSSHLPPPQEGLPSL